MRFNDWLMEQADRDDPVGDLAKEARSDIYFPRKGVDREEFVQYLYSVGACDGTLEAFDDAWKEFNDA